MANDVTILVDRISQVERMLGNRKRYGRVSERKPGMIRVRFDANDDAGGGQGGDEFFQSPWLRTAQHNGFVSQNTPYELGQGVAVEAANGDFTQATVHPHTHSKHNPLADDVADDMMTYRIRKPREGGDVNAEEMEAKADDPVDFQEQRKHDYWLLKIGDNAQIEIKPGQAQIKVGEHTFTMTLEAADLIVGASHWHADNEQTFLTIGQSLLRMDEGNLLAQVGPASMAVTPGTVDLNIGAATVHMDQGTLDARVGSTGVNITGGMVSWTP